MELPKILALELMNGGVGMSKGLNVTVCPANCTFPRGKCINGTCVCEFLFNGDYCESFSSSYLATFATLCYLLFLIATVQLILCMICDAQESEDPNQKLRKAFRMTIRKCLLGTVIGAMGTRGIYFTVQHFSFPEKWAVVLHDLYYPLFITAFSVLICFWAEVFYYDKSELFQVRDFMKNHQYFICCTVFNIMLYLLLLGDIIATPLVNDIEQNRKSIVIGGIFVVLLLLMLIGFLHYGIRLFFRPDWRSLSDVIKINLTQQRYSCVGVISSALMQCVIIALLLLNLVSRFGIIDFHSLCTTNTFIHVIELGLPIWFCCSLWNFKRPSNLWLLNPGLLLQEAARKYSDNSDRTSLINSKMSVKYGSVQQKDQQHQDCWICLDKGDVTDLYTPCKCPEVHRQCLKKWMAERVLNNSRKEAYCCQVCKTKYRVKKKKVCITKEMSNRHRVIGFCLILLFLGVSSSSVFIQYIKSNTGKAVLAFVIIVLDAIILKCIGFGLYWLYQHMRHKEIIILDRKRPADDNLSLAAVARSHSSSMEFQLEPTPESSVPTQVTTATSASEHV